MYDNVMAIDFQTENDASKEESFVSYPIWASTFAFLAGIFGLAALWLQAFGGERGNRVAVIAGIGAILCVIFALNQIVRLCRAIAAWEDERRVLDDSDTIHIHDYIDTA